MCLRYARRLRESLALRSIVKALAILLLEKGRLLKEREKLRRKRVKPAYLAIREHLPP